MGQNSGHSLPGFSAQGLGIMKSDFDRTVVSSGSSNGERSTWLFRLLAKFLFLMYGIGLVAAGWGLVAGVFSVA